MLPELLRLLRKPQRYLACFRDGEIYIHEIPIRRRVRALQGSRQPRHASRGNALSICFGPGGTLGNSPCLQFCDVPVQVANPRL